ncbi:MAG: amidase, partial [Acetobacteraceae bacterium]|nr:amidase [Acetobacteraceae bacterium]
AVVVRDFERARETARALDNASEEDKDGPLFGVPMTVKESFDVAGLPTTWGYEHHKDNMAKEDALAVQRFKRAGAVIFGKTNVPVSLMDWQSFNPIYGTTSNPWNPDHTPGGSSGGAAAALAAGFAGLEAGSDIGGSIRVPAHYCGVFGHKPTWGLCPPRGHSLVGAAAMTDISVIGPLARSAGDLGLALDLLGRPDEAETGLELRLPSARLEGFRGLRVALWPDQPGVETDAETVAKLRELGRFLEREEAYVDMYARPAFDPEEAFHLYLRLLFTGISGRMTEEALAQTREEVAKLAPDDMSSNAIMIRCVDLPHRDWLRLNERRHQLRRIWGAFFQEWDVLLCPVIATPAMPHMQAGLISGRRVPVNEREIWYDDMLFWPGLTGGYHLPATVAPLGFSQKGLPIGVQIAGPLYGDRTTIHVAGLLEQAGCRFTPPPGYEDPIDARPGQRSAGYSAR